MRAVLGSRRFDRRDQTAVGQFAGVNSVDSAPQCLQAFGEVACGVVKQRRVQLKPCLPELHGGSDEVLLRPVVQVAFDAQPLDFVRLRDSAS